MEEKIKVEVTPISFQREKVSLNLIYIIRLESKKIILNANSFCVSLYRDDSRNSCHLVGILLYHTVEIWVREF